MSASSARPKGVRQRSFVRLQEILEIKNLNPQCHHFIKRGRFTASFEGRAKITAGTGNDDRGEDPRQTYFTNRGHYAHTFIVAH